MKFLLHTSKNHFRWLLWLKKKYYNQKRKRQLEEKGYKFINIEEFEKLRNLEDANNFSWDKNKTTEQIHTKNNEILSITTRKRRRSPRKRRKRTYSEIENESLNELKETNKNKRRRINFN